MLCLFYFSIVQHIILYMLSVEFMLAERNLSDFIAVDGKLVGYDSGIDFGCRFVRFKYLFMQSPYFLQGYQKYFYLHLNLLLISDLPEILVHLYCRILLLFRFHEEIELIMLLART